jgi:hypothetical protein
MNSTCPGLCLVAFVLVALCAVVESASGFVGVHDVCSMPTPYPPALAGWAAENYSDFGFFQNCFTGPNEAVDPGCAN